MGHYYLIVSGQPCIPDECLEGFRICMGRRVLEGFRICMGRKVLEGLPFILPDSALAS